MSIRVELYTAGGIVSGVLARPGHLREWLERDVEIPLEQASWQVMDGIVPHASGQIMVAVDDIIVAAADDDPVIPVHAAWHSIRLEAGPFEIRGELPTLPGFDPGRALTRPSGEFVHLRDVTLAIVGRPDQGAAALPHALVNRYSVELVSADLMLGFFFPGAAMAEVPTGGAPA